MQIWFEAPTALLSLNDRGHWAPRARLVAAWRGAAKRAALKTLATRGPLPPCLVTVTLTVADRRRRDPHNFVATVKPIVDGLVDAGLWPDDTPEWISVAEPMLIMLPRASVRMVRVELLER